MSGPLRIWVNRSYATSLHALRLLRENADGVDVTIIGTHADRDSPVLTGCDEIADEPPAQVCGAAYGAWALDFAVRHRVDVLWPRHEQEAVAAAAGALADVGVAVVAPPDSVIAHCEDKERTYATAEAAGVEVPPRRVVRDADELRCALTDLQAEVGPGTLLCVKPVSGVGGVGFRVVRDEAPSWAALQAEPDPVVTSVDLLGAYASADRPGALLVQPWLDEPELSVDLLADRGVVLAAVTRGKPLGDVEVRARWVRDDPALAEPVAVLARTLGLHSLANVQFRWWRGRAVLLEVNPRASAGLYQSALAGVDLVWAAVRLARGLPVPPAPPVRPTRYADVAGVVALPGHARRLDS